MDSLYFSQLKQRRHGLRLKREIMLELEMTAAMCRRRRRGLTCALSGTGRTAGDTAMNETRTLFKERAVSYRLTDGKPGKANQLCFKEHVQTFTLYTYTLSLSRSFARLSTIILSFSSFDDRLVGDVYSCSLLHC